MMLKSLIGRGLIAAGSAQASEPAWSGSADQSGQALEITPEGRALIVAGRPAPPRARLGRLAGRRLTQEGVLIITARRHRSRSATARMRWNGWSC